MARISTGKELGGVVRSTPQRLLGGEQVTGGTAGEIAAAGIAAPGLQPLANPVNTFVQTGAPTLGGPVRFFPLPDVNPPSKDMGNLAQALGEFNPNLWRVGGALVEQQQQQEKQREQEAIQFVQQAGKYGPVTGVVELQRTLEKKAGEGDPGAAKLLQYFLSRNPSMWRWIAEKTQETAILNNVSTLARRARETEFIDDGQGGQVELASLSPDDERYLKWQSDHIFRDTVVSPAVMGRYNNLIIQTRTSDFDRQEKARIDYSVREFKKASSLKLQSLANGWLTNSLAPEQVTEELQRQLDDGRLVGLPPDERQKVLEGYMDTWISAISTNAYAQNNPDKVKDAFIPLALLMTGPEEQRVKADGSINESLRLINVLGGPDAIARIKSGLRTKYIQMVREDQQMQEVTAEQYAVDLVKQVLTPEVMRNPAMAAKVKQDVYMQLERQFSNDPRGFAAAKGLVDKTFGDKDAAYNDFARENLSAEYLRRLSQAAMDPAAGTLLRRDVMEAMDNRWITPAQASGILSTLDSYARADARPYREVAKDLMDAKLQQWELYAKAPGSYKNTYIDDFEVNAMAKAKGLMEQETARVISEGVKAGKGPDQINNDLQALFKTRNFGLKQRQDSPQEREKKQAFATPQDWYRSNVGWLEGLTGGGSPSPDQRNRLKNQIRSQPLYSRDVLGTQLDDVLKGKELDNETRVMIRRSGVKPSEFFMNQLRQHNILNTIDDDTLRRIKALDGTLKVSSVSPIRAMPYVAMDPYVRQMRDLGQSVARASLDLVAPPAMASPMAVTAPAVVGPINVTKFRRAVIGKESGGNFKAVNPDSGALGYGQVMPYNVGPWTARFFGRRLTPAQYLRNPQAQVAVMDGVMGEYLQQQLAAGFKGTVAIRRAAAMWYGGPKGAKLYDSDKPQYYNGRRYPSFREYTTDIARRYARS